MRKLLLILILFLIYFSLTKCAYKVSFPLPDSIQIIKNGERISGNKGNAEFSLALENISKIIGQSLVLRKNEKTIQSVIENDFKIALNGYKLNYASLSSMKILLTGHYTEEINFHEIYIIRKIDVHYIYFVLKGEPNIYPYIPSSEVMRLPRG